MSSKNDMSLYVMMFLIGLGLISNQIMVGDVLMRQNAETFSLKTFVYHVPDMSLAFIIIPILLIFFSSFESRLSRGVLDTAILWMGTALSCLWSIVDGSVYSIAFVFTALMVMLILYLFSRLFGIFVYSKIRGPERHRVRRDADDSAQSGY